MNKEIKVSYHNDVFFKYMMNRDDKSSVFIRHAIIEALTGIKPNKSVVLNPEIDASIMEGKNIVLDVHLKDEMGREFDIEMQVSGNLKTERMRFEYYGAKMLSNQLQKGEMYTILKPVYQIIFIDANIEDNTELIDLYMMRNKHGRQEHNGSLITRIYVYLPVVNSIAKKKGILHMNAFEQSCYLFKNNENDDILKSKKELVIKIMEKYNEMHENKSVWSLAEAIEIGKARYDNIIQDKFEEGMEKGIKKGIKKGIEKGIKTGIEEGRQTKARNIMKKLIEVKFNTDASSWLSSLNEEQLDFLSENILCVDSFEDLKNIIEK